MTLHAISNPDEELEQRIDAAYKRLCNAQSKAGKTRAQNEMYALMAQRSWRKVGQMEQARMKRIKEGG